MKGGSGPEKKGRHERGQGGQVKLRRSCGGGKEAVEKDRFESLFGKGGEGGKSKEMKREKRGNLGEVRGKFERVH